MLAKVAGGFGITSVEVSTHHSAVAFAHATGCGALENVDAAIVDVCDGGCLVEEHIHR
jgi:hypothetical protein